MIYIAICDDEKYTSGRIRKLISDFFHEKNIEMTISQFSNGEELLKYDNQIDILFLDIQMNKVNGLETARILRNRKFKGYLIFITILKEMVFQSFEVQPFDYLVKPIEKQTVTSTLERLLSSMKNARVPSLLIQKGYQNRIVSLDDIIFCEIIDRKVYLHLITSDVIDYYDRIENLEKKLDSRFFRCHRSFLVNLKYLKSYKNGIAYLEGGKEIPVSRLRNKEFSNVILQYMKEW